MKLAKFEQRFFPLTRQFVVGTIRLHSAICERSHIHRPTGKWILDDTDTVSPQEVQEGTTMFNKTTFAVIAAAVLLAIPDTGMAQRHFDHGRSFHSGFRSRGFHGGHHRHPGSFHRGGFHGSFRHRGFRSRGFHHRRFHRSFRPSSPSGFRSFRPRLHRGFRGRSFHGGFHRGFRRSF